MRKHWFYGAFLTFGLLVAIGAAVWSVKGHSMPPVEVPVLGFVFSIIAMLIALQQRLNLYIFGVLCILLAFSGFFLASPDGGRWTAATLIDDPSYGDYGGRWFGVLFLLFPAGWILLASSTVGWKVGLGSYLLAGLIFTITMAAFFGPPRSLVALVLFFLWPRFLLQMIGMFGWSFG